LSIDLIFTKQSMSYS